MGADVKTLGLIGFPLGHSFSVGYFNEKFRRENINGYEYLNFPISDIADLPGLIEHTGGLIGLNVTIPHKQAVIPYLSEIDEDAKAIGAVNVLTVRRSGGTIHIKGHNTDLIGIRECLNQWELPSGIRALVLGTGGSSRAVCRELDIRKIEYTLVSRTPNEPELGYSDLSESLVRERKLIINCTPVGMFPKIQNKPEIPYHGITVEHYLFDLIYNPETTLFMQEGLVRGAAVQGGLRMLHAQAEASWDIWKGL
jgi:shikimate dehydrogenase